jgi:hypothetical protein
MARKSTPVDNSNITTKTQNSENVQSLIQPIITLSTERLNIYLFYCTILVGSIQDDILVISQSEQNFSLLFIINSMTFVIISFCAFQAYYSDQDSLTLNSLNVFVIV